MSQDVVTGTWAARYHQPGVAALYLHIPFCVQKCLYCDFASWATDADDPLMASYVAALVHQLHEAGELGLLERCETAYVGGGTPTLLGPLLPQLVADVCAWTPEMDELTCEANPDSLSDGLVASLVQAGATRLSVGVQSLNDGELRALGRIHDAAKAHERVTAAVASGLDVSCDLMCAIPRQTDASWQETLQDAVGLGVGHVSVYPLAIEEGTPFGRRYANDDPAWNDPDVQADRMERARAYLEAQGLPRYEVASYARPGKACRHNQAYWTGLPYLGLGTGASGMVTREGYELLRGTCPQLPELPADTARVRLSVTSGRTAIARDPRLAALHFDIEALDTRQAVAEDLMLGMRLVEGVPKALLDLACEVVGRDAVGAAVGEVVDRGLAAPTAAGGLAPTHEGWLLGNELYAVLWSLAGKPVAEFSC